MKIGGSVGVQGHGFQQGQFMFMRHEMRPSSEYSGDFNSLFFGAPSSQASPGAAF